MQKGYEYKHVKCPECGKDIAENWFIRHMEKEHPEPVTTKSQPWTGSPEQLRRAGVEGTALHFYGEMRKIITLLYDLPHTDREDHIAIIASAALDLADREIEKWEELSNAN